MSNDFFNKVKEGLAGSESGNNYGAVFKSSTNPALGKYQFTQGRLDDLGYSGISQQDFLNNKELQEEVMDKHLQAAYIHMQKNGIVSGKLDAKEAGLLWSYHLGGYGGAQKAAQGLEGPADALGTTPLKYFYKGLKNFSGQKGAVLVEELGTVPDFQPFNRAAPLKNSVSAADAFSSSVRRESDVVAMLERLKGNEYFQPDSNFNPFDMENIEQYEPVWNQLEDAVNEKQAKTIMEKYDQLLIDQKNQVEGGSVALLGSIVGGVVSPFTYIPLAGILSKASKLASVAKLASKTKSIKTISGVTTGLATAGAVGAQEAFLQDRDLTRSAGESIAAIVTAGLIGTAAGTFAGKRIAQNAELLKKELSEQLQDVISKDIKGSRVPIEKKEFKPFLKPSKSSKASLLVGGVIGATALSTEEAEAGGVSSVAGKVLNKTSSVAKSTYKRTYEIAKSNPVFNTVNKALSKVAPVNRLLNSPIRASRKWGNQLFEHSFVLEDTNKGIPSVEPLETVLKAKLNKVNVFQLEYSDSLKSFLRKNPNLTDDVFNDEFLGVVEGSIKSNNESINKLAQKWNAYTRDVYNRAANLGAQWNPELVGKYFTRSWDFDKIKLQPRQFEIALAKEMELRGIPNHLDKAAQLVSELRKGSTVVNLEMLEMLSVGQKQRKLTGLFLNEDLNVYRNKDVDTIMSRYIRDMETELTFKETLGNKDPKIAMKADIDKDYMKTIDKTSSSQEIKKLNKSWASDIKDAEAVIDVLRGKYKTPSDPHSMLAISGRALKAISYLSIGGLMGLSQAADAGRLLFADAINTVAGKELTEASIKINKLLVKLSKEDLKELGVSLETSLAGRTGSLSNLQDLAEASSKTDKMVKKAVDIYSNYGNFINPINDVLRRTAAQTGGTKMIKAIKLWQKNLLAEDGIRDMLRYGISKEDAIDALVQFSKHSEDVQGVKILNIHKWEGEGAAKVIRALKRSVDETIITPGAGDLPLWMRTPVGSVLGQFKAFSFTAVNRVLLPTLQNPTGKDLTKILAQTSLGTLVYLTKAHIAGHKDIDTSTGKLILEGIDRSGVLGYLSDLNNIMEKMSGIGLYKLTESGRNSKLYNRGILASLLGPSAGLFENFATGMGGVINGEPTPAEVRKLLTVAPLSNMIGIGRLKNELSEQLGTEK